MAERLDQTTPALHCHFSLKMLFPQMWHQTVGAALPLFATTVLCNGQQKSLFFLMFLLLDFLEVKKKCSLDSGDFQELFLLHIIDQNLWYYVFSFSTAAPAGYIYH